MGELVPHGMFRQRQREKKYGTDASIGRRLKAMGLPDDYNPMVDFEVNTLLYGESEEDEEDFWLGEKDLTQIIR